MGKSQDPIVKRYSFSTDERESLAKLEMGLISFEQAIMGMQLNKNIILQRAYRRCGIDSKGREGYDQRVGYNLETNEITVTLTPKDEVEKKDGEVEKGVGNKDSEAT